MTYPSKTIRFSMYAPGVFVFHGTLRDTLAHYRASGWTVVANRCDETGRTVDMRCGCYPGHTTRVERRPDGLVTGYCARD